MKIDYIFILFFILFCHIIDDYYLQGWLASAKQKSWWQKNAPNKLYAHDYKMALFMHCFSWTFMILVLPSMLGFYETRLYLILFTVNFLVHMLTDNAKANQMKINLVIDQSIHIIQIVCTWLIYVVLKLH